MAVRNEPAWVREGVDEDGLESDDTGKDAAGVCMEIRVVSAEVAGMKVTADLRPGINVEDSEVLEQDLSGRVVVGVKLEDGANMAEEMVADVEAEDCDNGIKEIAADLRPGMETAGVEVDRD